MTARDPLRDLVLAFARRGITRREDRIRLCIDHAGRHLTTSTDLTPAEVTTLLERLAALPAGTDLPAVVARLHAAEEQRAATAAARSIAVAHTVTTRLQDHPTTDPVDAAVTVLRDAGVLAPQPLEIPCPT